MSDHKKHKKKHKHKDRYHELDSRGSHSSYKGNHQKESGHKRASPHAYLDPMFSKHKHDEMHTEPERKHHHQDGSSQTPKKPHSKPEVLDKDNLSGNRQDDELARYERERRLHDERPVRDERRTQHCRPLAGKDISQDYEFQWELHRNTLNKIFFTEDDYIKR